CHVTTLRLFFGFLVENNILPLDPSRGLKPPRLPQKLPRNIPSSGQMRRLLSVAKRDSMPLRLRDAAIIEVLYGTGLRNAELCALKLHDYDPAQRIVFVRKGKGGKDRVVPVGHKAAEALDRYLAIRKTNVDGESLFLTAARTPLTTATVRQLLTRLLARAGLLVERRRITPHTLRHACATHLF